MRDNLCPGIVRVDSGCDEWRAWSTYAICVSGALCPRCGVECPVLGVARLI